MDTKNLETNEIEVMTYFLNKGWNVSYNKELDLKYAIDIIVQKKEIIYFIQVKSKGFLFSQTVKDLLKIENKMKRYTKKGRRILIVKDDGIFKALNLYKLDSLHQNTKLFKLKYLININDFKFNIED